MSNEAHEPSPEIRRAAEEAEISGNAPPHEQELQMPAVETKKEGAEEVSRPEKGDLVSPEKKKALHDLIRWNVISTKMEGRGLIWEGPPDAEYKAAALQLSEQEQAMVYPKAYSIYQEAEKFAESRALNRWPDKEAANKAYLERVDELINQALEEWR